MNILGVLSPNPKALTLSLGIPAEPMRISIPRMNDKAASISPLSGEIFRQLGFVNRIDLFERDNMQHITLISKMMTWSERPEMIRKAAMIIMDNIQASPILNIQEAKAKLPMLHFFDPAGNPVYEHVKDVFESSVRKKLAKDGGDAELLDITLDRDTGRIDIKAVMIGSCGACPVSQSTTLSDTTKDIDLSLIPIKAENPNVALVQKLHIGGIESISADKGLVIAMR